MVFMTPGAYALPATSLQFKTGNWRTQRPIHQPRPAPCRVACPAGENPQAYLALVAQGRARAAWELLVSANPLPAISGRVCDHPCESACNRGQYDEAIAIHNVERYLGDLALREQWPYPLATPDPNAPTVAVVGAGPAGLSCAYHLIRQGLRVSLFDRLPEAGGMLRMALPPYRLPRDVLDTEIFRLLASGIDFQPRKALGRDMSLEELRSNFAAVFLGPGRNLGRAWDVDGRTPDDLHTALNLLQEWVALGRVPQIKSAAIVGGGNSALDMARVLRCIGADVHLITYDALPGPGVDRMLAMKAAPRDIQQAIEEGVIIHPHRGIRRLILRGEKVVGLEMVHMQKIPQADGQLAPVIFEGTETVLHVDQVIPAIGQDVDPVGMESLLRQRHAFRVDDDSGLVGHSGVFAGGDARAGSLGTVSGAVGDGRRAAHAILTQLRGLAGDVPAPAATLRYEELNLNYFEHAPRAQEPLLPVERRQACAEIAGGLSHDEVGAEAGRCFSCGTCMACDNCWTLCPDHSVLKTRELAVDGSHYVFDYDYCKGCGLCANECPCGYIAMVDEDRDHPPVFT